MPDLRRQLEQISREWIAQGLPSREQVITCAEALMHWRRQHDDHGLWFPAPRMLTATLDDGLGQGLDIIHLFATTMGMVITPLGLMQSPESILAACRQQCPEYLGLTVLQPDTEEALARIGLHLAPETCLVAGGPAFRYDAGMAARSGVDFVAANVAYFIDFALKDSRLKRVTPI